MKRFQLILLIVAVVPYSSSGAESADEWPAREFQPLFNGRNLDGWRMNVGVISAEFFRRDDLDDGRFESPSKRLMNWLYEKITRR
ncbi:MAG TPA: hypothetical protein VG099_07155 [Gemmataceae bacterium]|jgi:hypothetical protein|nr:hypothetical protein [Gemmataceae bacterium]